MTHSNRPPHLRSFTRYDDARRPRDMLGIAPPSSSSSFMPTNTTINKNNKNNLNTNTNSMATRMRSWTTTVDSPLFSPLKRLFSPDTLSSFALDDQCGIVQSTPVQSKSVRKRQDPGIFISPSASSLEPVPEQSPLLSRLRKPGSSKRPRTAPTHKNFDMSAGHNHPPSSARSFMGSPADPADHDHGSPLASNIPRFGSSPKEHTGMATVQVLGMNIAQSQPLARDSSGNSTNSSPSGASTPYHQSDYPASRTYLPPQGLSSSRTQARASFSTGTSPSPIGGDSQEELNLTGSTLYGAQHESSSLRVGTSSQNASRKPYMSHGNRVLAHKDSFGGTYGLLGPNEVGSKSTEDVSISSFADLSHAAAHSRFADESIEDSAYVSHYRNPSLSQAASHASRQDTVSANSTIRGGSEITSSGSEPIEMLGQTLGRNHTLPTSSGSFEASPTQSTHSRAALSAAVAAATAAAGSAASLTPDDTGFSSRFDSALSLAAASTSAPTDLLPNRSASEQKGVRTKPSYDRSLPGNVHSSSDHSAPKTSNGAAVSNAAAQSSAYTSKPSMDSAALASGSRHASQRNNSTPVTVVPSSDLADSKATTASASSRDRRERGERERERNRGDRPSTSDRARETTGSSSVNRSDPSTSSLKSSHRTLPQLPSASNVKPAPPPAMYWSKAPVHGSVPKRSFRAHTSNLCDEVLWLFGGCDNKGCFRDLWCFDTDTMCWSRPKVTGDIPPARRAHTATMVNKRLFVFAGGDGPNYFNDLYVFDTVSLRWSKPEVFGTPPSPRRAHTCNYHEGQLIVFGGGNGVGALNDVHTLDVNDLSRLEWRKLECSGKIPIGRGYHTSNLVDGKLIVIGGSDGHMSFNDIHILRLDTRTWYQVKTEDIHNRLGHTATQVGSYLFIFGGHDSKTYTSELLTLNLVNLQWEPRKVCGKKPQGRGYHQAWLRDSRLFIHGGFDGKDIFEDLHFLDLAACAYLPQITSFSVELDEE